jgi:hypothetical protein
VLFLITCSLTSAKPDIPPLTTLGVKKPGQIALIRIPLVAYSNAEVKVSPITFSFAAQY